MRPDYDALIAAMAKAILATRAKGLSRQVWGHRAAAAALLALEKFDDRPR